MSTLLNAAVAAAVAQAAQHEDMNVASAGGGDYTPPAAGTAIATLVGYVETGKHESIYDGQVKINDNVELIFELSGANYPVSEFNGEKIPQRLAVKITRSLSERSWLFKMFAKMNYNRDASIMAELVGKHFLADIIHTPNKKNPKVVYANIVKDSVRKPEVTDPIAGTTTLIPKPETYSEPRIFLWEYANKDMWDSLFIDGEYAEQKDDQGKVTRPARSKNVFQNAIKSAVNFEGSPIHLILSAGGDLSAAALPSTSPDDVLAAGLADVDDPTAGLI